MVEKRTILQIVSVAASGQDGQRSIGGPERRSLTALDFIDGDRFRVVVAYAPSGRLHSSFREVAERSAHISLVPFDPPRRRDWRSLAELKAMIEAHDVDVVHSQGAHGTDWWAASAARLTGAACIVARAIALPDYHLRRRTFLRFLWTERRALRHMHAMVFESSDIRDRAVACGEIDRQRARVIPNGIDLRRFGAVPVRSADAPPTFGMVAQLLPVKDWDTFLDAAGRIFAAVPGSRGVMVGDGPERDRLRAAVAARGWEDRMHMTGFQADVRPFLAGMDVFMLTSQREGLPIAIAEAMATARPVVATNVGGVSDMVRDGETGFLTRPRDPAGIAERVIGLLRDRDRRERFGKNARERAEHTLSIDAMVRAYEDLYDEAAAGRRRRVST